MRIRMKIGSLIVTAAVTAVAFTGCKRAKTGPDLSSPRSAALTFAKALEQGDAATAKAASFGGPDDERVVETMADVAGALTRLSRSATAKFGEAGRLLVDERGPVKVSDGLENAEVQMTPDKASIVPAGSASRTIHLKNIDGKWKVDVGMLTGGRDVSSELPRLRAFAQAAKETAGAIDAGTVKSVDETRQFLLNKVAPGTTRPVDAPDTEPL